ncbi:MAG: M6 family metalloprotease domain-containing protein [Desulfurococcaceae archaeon]
MEKEYLSKEYWIRSSRRYMEYAMKTAGNVRTLMITVDFPNAPYTEAPAGYRDPLAYYRWFLPAVDWFEASSYGKLNLEIEISDKWYRMSRNDYEYNIQWGKLTWEFHAKYVNEAVELASNDHDISLYDAFYIVPSRNAINIQYSPTFISSRHSPVISKGKVISHAVTFGKDMWRWGFKVLIHETGHLMGLPDLYAYEPLNIAGRRDIHYYVGGWDIMGYIAGHAPDFMAWHKLRLGWIDSDQVEVVSEKGVYEYELTPIEINGGLKLVIIPINENSAYGVESRRPIVNDETSLDWGVLIYRIDLTARSGHGPIKIIDAYPGDDVMPSRDLDHACFRKDGNAIFVDRDNEISVIVIEEGEKSDVIKVCKGVICSH